MNFGEERILRDGIFKSGNVLKVDSFLNHQMDMALLDEIGAEFHRRFAGKNINKVLTIEASGVAIACSTARYSGVPMLFAKKSKTVSIDEDMYVAEVESFTHKCKSQVIVSKKCTIMMFGNIVVSGLQMIGKCGYFQRNITVVALSLGVGLGFTQAPDMFNIFPDIVRTNFAENCVAVVFILAIIFNLVLHRANKSKTE